MAAHKRPLSPHLQVYKPQITSVLSITHRLTGIALSLGTVLFVYWLVSAALGPQAYATAQGLIGSFIGYVLLFGWSAALFYHLCNGIRHLMWDTGRGFAIAEVERSGYMVLIAAGSLTLFAWLVGLFGG